MELRDFAGTWQIARLIRQADGRDARFEGRAVLAPDGDGLDYHEDGLLYLAASPPMRAERRYLWRADGSRIAVFFEDGRAFHQFDPGGTALSDASHWCDPDDYRVRYDFSDWPEWRTEWRVTGPRKDYTMVSRYSPAR